MARIDKAKLTRIEIIRVATRKFLIDGYSDTSVKAIADELGMSTGNLTFYFPTKEHLLAELVKMLCDFQGHMMTYVVGEGYSSLMDVCLEMAAMVVMCEESASIKDFYLSAYSSPVALEIIRQNDLARAKQVFAEFCAGWTEEQFVQAETMVSGIEYATLMTTAGSASVEARITGALNGIMQIYNVPEEMRRTKIEKVLAMDHAGIGQRVFKEFTAFVEKAGEQALEEMLFVKKAAIS